MRQKNYFIQIPNLIDDADLSPMEVRIYLRLRRICGDDGVCTQGTRLLDKGCGISITSVIRAKKGLKEKGLITIRKIQTPNGEGDEIELADIWDVNESIYLGKAENHRNPTALQQTIEKAGERYLKSRSISRRTRVPDDFKLDAKMRLWAKENTPNTIGVDLELENFLVKHEYKLPKYWERDFQEWLIEAQKLWEEYRGS